MRTVSPDIRILKVSPSQFHSPSPQKCHPQKPQSSSAPKQATSSETIFRKLIGGVGGVALSAAVMLSPLSALADMPPQPTTEVPAAVETVITQGNEAVRRENESAGSENSKPKPGSNEEKNIKIALSLAVDGEPAGTVIIRAYNDPPVGSKRFLALAQRRSGGYRLSKVDGISDDFVTVSGILQLNYQGMDKLPGGETVEELEAEQTLSSSSHDRAGLVSLIVKDAIPTEVKEKMVAYNGKLIKVQEVRGKSNVNGTGFAITLGSAELLDKTNLIVGEVIEGLDVVEKLAKLPRVKSSSNSPFFKVAKALGDRRADVAARSFGKPLQKVVVSNVEIT